MKVIVILNTDVVDLQLDTRKEFISLAYCYVHVYVAYSSASITIRHKHCVQFSVKCQSCLVAMVTLCIMYRL